MTMHNGNRVSFWGDKKVSGLESGDDCVTELNTLKWLNHQFDIM